ncbi:hypothetical protein [Cupriavidus sp. CP313]
MNYFNLNRRFVERESYNQDELIASEVIGKRVDWPKVLECRASVVVAPANFGKTTEMEHQAEQMRSTSEAAVFVALRRLADLKSLDRALEGDSRVSYLAWKSSTKGTLTIFVDSLDEAAAGKAENIEYLVDDILNEVSWAKERVRWVISTRPAILTAQVFDKLSDLLVPPSSTVRTATATPPTVGETSTTSSTASPVSGEAKRLRLFSMVQLDRGQAELYLKGRHPRLEADRLLLLARERGLGGFTRSPGGLDIIAHIDLLTDPPDSLTEVFRRVVRAVHVLRARDHRFEDAGNPSTELLERAAQKLASASQACQLLNIEMPEGKLAIPEKALSARLIATPMLPERAVEQLLTSQLFIDVGFHQVKMYPDELPPFLAAERLAELVESTDQALRLVQNFTWSSPSGEEGIQREFLPLMGWLATLNRHCRAVILRYDPQALAFFGDLRNRSVPLADAEAALTESIRRFVEQGDHPGRGMFTLTSENYWQAGPERLVPVISRLFDEYGWHNWARDTLMDIATACKLDVLRTRVLRRHGRRYARLLGDSADVQYLLELGRLEDLVGLAVAVQESDTVREGVAALLLGKLGWEHFTPSEVARLIDKQFGQGRDGFSIGYVLDSGGLLASATDEQLYQLCRGLVTRVARLRERTGHRTRAHARTGEQYFEMTADAVAALVRRTNQTMALRTARLCLVLQRVSSDAQFFSADESGVYTALDENTFVRRALLGMVAKQSWVSDQDLLMAIIGHSSACTYQTEDVEEVNDPRLSRLYSEYRARVAAQPKPKLTRVPKSPRDRLKVSSEAKNDLKSQLPSLRDGTAGSALVWVTGWLLKTNPQARYGEVNFEVFEREAGREIADAVRKGLMRIWRNRPPRFDETEPRSTYHITAAGLQGLHLELGQGTSLPTLSETEVRRALRYATFEINGYPKWFWPLVEAHSDLAASELSKIAEEAPNGPVSGEHAEELFASLSKAPAPIRETLIPLAWSYLANIGLSREYVAGQILRSVMASPDKVPRAEFERIALGKMGEAFTSPLPVDPDGELKSRRDDAVMWAGHWLTSHPRGFQRAVSKWGPKDPAAVKEFLAHMAAYFGRDHGGALVKLAQASDEGVMALEHLYAWTMWAVDPTQDVRRPEGVYSPKSRDNAQQMRDSLLGIIASANSQQAYDVLGRARVSAKGAQLMYIQKLQFELRERQFARRPLTQTNYDQFEKDFRADVTDSLSFSMAVHADLESVKYDIERGEHSLRSFFSELDFKRVNRPGMEGEKAGLALEANFQRLLASELNHHARRRYSVSVESHTAESRRRDVLCSRGDWRASIELKMSERWTLEQYVEALERQLVGQYMRHNKAVTGFLVIVLQTKGRSWMNTATGTRVEFDDLLTILAAKAQALEAKDRSRYLRVIGIDATSPEDFRQKERPASGARGLKPMVRRRKTAGHGLA